MPTELLSIGRESIVYKEGDSVFKSYTPETHHLFGRDYRKIFGESDCVHLSTYDKDRRRYFFYKESALLRALSGIEPRIVPQFRGVDGRRLTIEMEYVPYPTYGEAMLRDSGLSPVAITEKMVIDLAALHSVCQGNNLAVLKREAGLKPRSTSFEVDAWRKYLQAIIYYGSNEFEEYCSSKGLNLQTLEPRGIRNYVNLFLRSRSINLEEKLKEFIGRDRELMEGEKGYSFSWGEAKPQNMFLVPSGDATRVIDFPRASLSLGNDADLVNVIYNVNSLPFRAEGERDSLLLAQEYFTRRGVSLGQFPIRRARLLASRVKENVRLFANYCQKNSFEIDAVFGPPRSDADGSGKEAFLEKMLNSMFRQLFDYYRYRSGEGWELLMEGYPASTGAVKETVRQQLITIEDILKESGVLRGIIRSQKRAMRFCKVLNIP